MPDLCSADYPAAPDIIHTFPGENPRQFSTAPAEQGGSLLYPTCRISPAEDTNEGHIWGNWRPLTTQAESLLHANFWSPKNRCGKLPGDWVMAAHNIFPTFPTFFIVTDMGGL